MPTQRDIVEVVYELPHENMKPHPAIIISNEAIHELEDMFYAVLCSGKQEPEEMSMELTPEMVNGFKMTKTTYIKTHIIQTYSFHDIIRHIGTVKPEAFKRIKEKITQSIFEAE